MAQDGDDPGDTACRTVLIRTDGRGSCHEAYSRRGPQARNNSGSATSPSVSRLTFPGSVGTLPDCCALRCDRPRPVVRFVGRLCRVGKRTAAIVAVDVDEGVSALIQPGAEPIGQGQAGSRAVDLRVEIGQGSAVPNPGTAEERHDLLSE